MDYNIGDMIAKLADKKEEVYSIICKVSKVSGEVAELAPLNGDASLFDVKLLANLGNSFFNYSGCRLHGYSYFFKQRYGVYLFIF